MNGEELNVLKLRLMDKDEEIEKLCEEKKNLKAYYNKIIMVLISIVSAFGGFTFNELVFNHNQDLILVEIKTSLISIEKTIAPYGADIAILKEQATTNKTNITNTQIEIENLKNKVYK